MKDLQPLNSVLNPSLIPKNLNGLEDHGVEHLKELVRSMAVKTVSFVAKEILATNIT